MKKLAFWENNRLCKIYMDHQDWIRGLVRSSNSSLADLDFTIPIDFITLITAALRSVNQMPASFIATVLSLDFAAIPYRLGLIVVAFVALSLGADLERRMQTTS